jgi:hypothetical protein
VVLLDRQVAFLDRLAASARATGRRGLTRAQIIRALIEALWHSRLEVPLGSSVQDFESLLTERLSQPTRRPRI